MPIDTQTKDYAASMRSAWVAPISPNKLLESWTDTLQKSIQSWQFPLPYKYDIISEPMRCLATEGTWQWGSCMQIWCTGCISPIHHLNVSPSANFVDPVQEKADKNPYCHKASWWHCALLMHLLEPRTKNSIVMSTSWCQVEAINLAFYISSFIQAATGYKCGKLPFSLVFHDHFSAKQ